MKKRENENMISRIKKDLLKCADPEKAKVLSRFFKTGKGQYAEGDVFLGIMVPEQRRVAKSYADLPLKDLRRLLSSRIHEHRLVSLFILVGKYKRAEGTGRKEIADFYLANRRHINNWDLVDLSAPHILGDYLLDNDRSVLFRLANFGKIWERRIAIMATFAFIRNGRFEDTLRIAEMLLTDDHDLIHKAVGWMLREIGKKDLKTEEEFLKKHYRRMPRTMLRYAIEKFGEKKRKSYLRK
jgi:3-methyladenine DNA glycosylase AlkD